MIIVFHKDFTKRFKRLTPKIKENFNKRLILFKKDEFNPALNNHTLKGKYQGYRSINISGDLRAIYKNDKVSIIFVTIDSHSNLYG